MKLKNGKLRKIFHFEIYQRSAVENFLQDMALQGWMLEAMSNKRFTFVPCEPKKIRFSVVYFDPPYSKGADGKQATASFINNCENNGWHFVCSEDIIRIFYTDHEDAANIVAKDRVALKKINKYALKKCLVGLILMLGLTLGLISNMLNFLSFVTSYPNQLVALLFTGIILINAARIISYFRWYYHARTQIRLTGSFSFANPQRLQYGHRILQIALFMIFAVFDVLFYFSDSRFIFIFFNSCLAIVGLTSFIRSRIDKKRKIVKKISPVTTVVICIIVAVVIGYAMLFGFISMILLGSGDDQQVFDNPDGTIYIGLSNDVIPLYLEDFGITGIPYHDTNAYKESTFLATLSGYSDYAYDQEGYDFADISYEVFSSPYQWIVDRYLAIEISNDAEKLVTTDWSADQLYLQVFGKDNYRYIAVYENKVLILDLSWKPDDQDIRKLETVLALRD